MTDGDRGPGSRNAWPAVLVGGALRAGAVWWAAERFPPAHDGRYYHTIAARIADGQGYTWAWPDGAVTYAAHYPVGYPAMVGALYAVGGPMPWLAMALNAAFGSAAVLAVQRLASTVTARRGALLAAFLVALHPGLVAYTPALMTEAVAGAILAVAAWLAVAARDAAPSCRLRWLVALAAAMGVGTLVRPQSLLLAPVFALLALPGGSRKRWLAAGLVVAGTVAVCLPWTARNCARMGRCSFVSANAGWNLLIGAGSGATGTWVPIDRIEESAQCAAVFDESAKDACFGRAGWSAIRSHPWRWLGLVPRKLSATFDAAGAPARYLRASNPRVITAATGRRLGAAELVVDRVIIALALLGLRAASGPRRRARSALAAVGVGLLVLPWAWVSYLFVVFSALLLGRGLCRRPALAAAVLALASTVLVHVIFFGASRYALASVPLLCVIPGMVLTGRSLPGDTSLQETPDAAHRD